MLYDKRNEWERGTQLEEVKRTSLNFFKDLRPFISLQIARLIVWRTLLARRFFLREEEQPNVAASRRTLAQKRCPQGNGK